MLMNVSISCYIDAGHNLSMHWHPCWRLHASSQQQRRKHSMMRTLKDGCTETICKHPCKVIDRPDHRTAWLVAINAE